MRFSSISSMEVRRLEAGILDNGTDFDSTMTPFEAGLGAFVDLDKQGFIGRAALLDAQHGTRLYGVKCADTTPSYHGEIVDGDTTVGRITAGAWSPYLEAGVGYVRFNDAGEWAGQKLSMKNADGDLVACEIVDLPFYDPEKRIPRGLDKTVP